MRLPVFGRDTMIKRAICLATLGLIMTISALPLHAGSDPSIAGNVKALELCPQDFCGAAIFSGLFQGLIDSNPRVGIMTGAITHQSPLPTDKDDFVFITGGLWELRTFFRRFTGIVLPGGKITSNGNNTFAVDAVFALGG